MSKHSCAVSVVHESRGACKEGAETTELLADAAVNVDEEEGARKRNQFYGEPNGAKRERKRECGNYCIFLGKGEIGKADCLLCLSKWGPPVSRHRANHLLLLLTQEHASVEAQWNVELQSSASAASSHHPFCCLSAGCFSLHRDEAVI